MVLFQFFGGVKERYPLLLKGLGVPAWNKLDPAIAFVPSTKLGKLLQTLPVQYSMTHTEYGVSGGFVELARAILLSLK